MKKFQRAYLKSKAVAKNRNRRPAKTKFQKPHGLFFIYGPPGSGKTSLMLNMARSACEHGKTVLYIDTNYAVTDSNIKGCGLERFYRKTFILVAVNSGREIMTLARQFMAVKSIVIIDSLDTVAPDSLLNGTLKLEGHTWTHSHRVQNHLIKTLKYESEQHGSSVIVTLNHSLKFNFGNDFYYPADWRAALADVYAEISVGQPIAPQAVNEGGTPAFTISAKGFKPVLDLDKAVGFKTMLAVYHRLDNPRQYEQRFAYHDFHFGSGFQFDFSQRRFLNLLLTEPQTDTQNLII